MTAKINRVALQASSTQTASNNGTAVTVPNSREAVVFLNVTAATGTLDVKIQTSDDGGTTWYDLPNGAFAQKTATGTQAIQITNFGDTIRCVSTIGGGTPSFTYAVKAVCK